MPLSGRNTTPRPLVINSKCLVQFFAPGTFLRMELADAVGSSLNYLGLHLRSGSGARARKASNRCISDLLLHI